MSDEDSLFDRADELVSRVHPEVWESSERRLAKSLPIYAIGHPDPAVRKLAGDLFELTMNYRPWNPEPSDCVQSFGQGE
jgi:hypothetical protein